MSVFEIISVVLSSIAIIVSVFPVIKKMVTKANVQFYPVGLVTLLFNQSGSYIQLNGVIESEKKAVSIRKMSVKIMRKKDNQTRNLGWSQLISPVNQRLVGNVVQTTECAHPFRVDGDSIMTTFVEYTDPFDSFGKAFRNCSSKLFEKADSFSKFYESDYALACEAYSGEEAYSKLISMLKDELFWKVGKYSLDVIVEYNNTKRSFKYEFTISEKDYAELSQNIEEAVLAPLKMKCGIKYSFNSANVEIV